jgi:maltooligosyltrehalose trehalohydrolase
VAENETQQAKIARTRADGGYGFDAIWNDDFHHSAIVAATGRAEAYYSGYRGASQEFVSAVKHGFLYQGQWFRWQKQRRGRPAFDLQPRNFVNFLQNHDQVANSLRGLRLHQATSPGKFRALTAMLLLAPSIPMLFQGQEFAATAPFLYFADHHEGLRTAVSQGRKKFLQQFRSIACDECGGMLADPADPESFRRSKLDFAERKSHADVYRLHADLLRLRREDPAIRQPVRVDGAVLSERAFVLRFFAPDGADRILIVNLSADQGLQPAPEPLLAPIEGHGWRVAWSSENPVYGGGGTPPLETTSNWIIPGEAAVLLAPDEHRDPPDAKLSEKD